MPHKEEDGGKDQRDEDLALWNSIDKTRLNPRASIRIENIVFLSSMFYREGVAV